ncbi:hypothetical protein [Streptomyces griseoluteus]
MTAVCISEPCSRSLRDHELAAGQLLCDPCVHQIRRWLAAIPAAMTVLRDGSMQRERTGDAGRTGTREAPLPCRLDTLSLIGPAASGTVRDPHGDQVGQQPIIGTLGSWVRLVLEERHVDGPAAWTPEALAGWLASQLGWISQQGWASEAYTELRDLTWAIRGIARVEVRTRAVSRPCPACELLSLQQTDWDRYVRCTNCGGCWTADELNHDAERRAAA